MFTIFLFAAIKTRFPKLYLFLKYGAFTANTSSYWDKIWNKENNCTLRIYPELFSTIVDLVPERSKALDIGCGLGILLRKLKKERRCDCYGIDISKFAIKTIEKYGIKGKVSKLPKIPFASQMFDVVIATEILEHLQKMDDTVKEVLRVLKNKGLFIVSVPDDCLGPEEWDEHFHKFSKGGLQSFLRRYVKLLRLESIKVNCKKNGRILVENRILAVGENNVGDLLTDA